MKKENIIILSLVVLLVLAFFYTFSFTQPARNCEEEDNKVVCIESEAIRTGDYSLCNQFDRANKSVCYLMIATDIKNPGVCNNLIDESDIDFCYLKAVRGLDIKDCEKLPEKTELKCVAYSSLYTLASGECEAEENDNGRELCFKLIAEILDEANICDLVDEKHVGLCDKYAPNNSELRDTLKLGQTKTYTLEGKDYETTAMVVVGDGESTKFIINNEVTDALGEGDEITINGGAILGIKKIVDLREGNNSTKFFIEFYIRD